MQLNEGTAASVKIYIVVSSQIKVCTITSIINTLPKINARSGRIFAL